MGEVLSQSEIDALLAALDAGELDPDQIESESENQRVKLYDFRRPEKFTKEQLRTLQMLHENFARSLSTYLATTLRTLVEIKVMSVEQLTYYEFTRSLPLLTMLAIFEIPEWEGRGLLECNLDLIFTMLDRMLGGAGTSIEEGRSLTDIEQGLVTQLMTHMANLYQDAWETVADVNFIHDSLETNPLFAQIVSQNETVALINFSAKIANTEAMLNICLPHMVLEKVMDKLTTRSWYAGQTRTPDPTLAERVRRSVDRLAVPLRVHLGEAMVSFNDLLNLQVGDCIPLDTRTNSMVKVKVGTRTKFLGSIGKVGNHLAVRVEKVLPGGEEDGE
ncbi:MAG: flagellar motor switch protein FliM [Firmicutes bacterium]|nr:flagellar motor switch protein FliM [Bacillota bacterium]